MARSARKHRSYVAHLKDIKTQESYGVRKGNVCCLDCSNFVYNYYCKSLKRVPAWRDKKRTCKLFNKAKSDNSL